MVLFNHLLQAVDAGQPVHSSIGLYSLVSQHSSAGIISRCHPSVSPAGQPPSINQPVPSDRPIATGQQLPTGPFTHQSAGTYRPTHRFIHRSIHSSVNPFIGQSNHRSIQSSANLLTGQRPSAAERSATAPNLHLNCILRICKLPCTAILIAHAPVRQAAIRQHHCKSPSVPPPHAFHRFSTRPNSNDFRFD